MFLFFYFAFIVTCQQTETGSEKERWRNNCKSDPLPQCHNAPSFTCLSVGMLSHALHVRFYECATLTCPVLPN